jgi:uncharacterized protein
MNCKFLNYKFLICIIFLILLSANAFAILSSGQTKIFAVTEDEVGMAAGLYLYTIPGDGEVAFVTSNSLVGKDTQTTGNISLQVAQQKTKVNPSSKNFIFDIKANASEVDGPSAGAAMTLLMYSVLSEKVLPSDVAVTGTINSDGSVGMVGGVYPKAKAASQVGIKLFMIPRGEANQVINDNGLKSINLLTYGPENLGMKIVEVTTIDDVLKFAYSEISSIVVDTQATNTVGFIPKAISYKSSLAPMKEMSANYLKRARAEVDSAKKELELTKLDDVKRSSFYPQLGIAERNIEMAKVFLDQNYLYSSANYSFNARVLAGAIKEIAITPSLLSNEPSVLKLKISSLNQKIVALKNQLVYIPLDSFEWVIGAQQRIAYAENALNGISFDANITDDGELFDRVYDYVSAEGWIEAANDFFDEAEKSSSKKIIYYSDDFVESIEKRIISVEELLKESGVSQGAVSEAMRRLNSAKISFDNNFYFAALFDSYFAEAFIFAELDRNNIENEKLLTAFESKLEETKVNSVWASLFVDHATFFLENAKFEGSINRQQEKISNLETGFDLVVLAGKIEQAKELVLTYLAYAKMDDYSEDTPIIDIKYVKRDYISPYLIILSAILATLLAMLILVGVYSNYSNGIKGISRSEKLHLVLNRLDKALAQKKVSDAEYFFMKKKYEDELNFLTDKRSKRSKIALSLDESIAKQRALERGIFDLKRHYKTGLIIPEDYERNIKHFTKEIEDLKENIKDCKFALKNSNNEVLHSSVLTKKISEKKNKAPRRSKFSSKKKRQKQSEFDVTGTGTKEMKKVKGTN